MENGREKITGGDAGVPEYRSSALIRFRRPLVDYLISGLEENDKWVRILAAGMLGSTGDPRAADYLTPLLVDRDQDLRMISAQSLEMIHSHQVLLFHAQPDQCAGCMIRLIAEEALARGRPRG
jgi:HEAT repeat protein